MQLQQRQATGVRPASTSRRGAVQPRALFGRKTNTAVLDKPATKSPKQTTKQTKQTTSGKGKPIPKQSLLEALDFSAVRSKRDAELLYDAKYGERGPDGKMSREQYQALRRKIGGTARDYWKDWIEEEQPKNIKPWAKEGDAAAVPFLPFLVGVVLAMLAATVVVVQQTS